MQRTLLHRNAQIKSLGDALAECRRRNFITESAEESLLDSFGSVARELVVNEIRNLSTDKRGRRYADVVKAFALTVFYYSPRAYTFLRSVFCLPTVSSLRDYNSSVDASPGFSSVVLKYLNQTVASKPFDNECCLVIDAMSIHKDTSWDRNSDKFVGNVDYGGFMKESDKTASEALVFMAVGLSSRWKIPVAYFFTDHAAADVQTNLVMDCVKRLYESGVIVRAVTCDGCEVNLRMFKNFGVTMDNTYFSHPSNPDIKIFGICDPCHMLKLVRNTLGDLKILVDKENRQIRWSHISQLVHTQESAGLKAANKLSNSHVQYHKHKMKVKLAAQVLSSSVADALDFLRVDCNDVKQLDNEATVEFIRTIDHLFDILNSHSPIAKGFKSALRAGNMQYWTESLTKFREYIEGLKSLDGISLLNHKRKTAFVGFIISINSVIGLATELLTREVNTFKYFLTYKLCQDHLELFFSKIRSRGGFNNNPSVVQFKAAYRSLILKNCISPSLNSNCTAFESDDGYIAIQRRSKSSSADDSAAEVSVCVEDYVSLVSRNKFLNNCLYYIAGFIVRSVSTSLSCEECILALNESILDVTDPSCCQLVNRKDRGGLRHPSGSVFKIISTTETVISHEIMVSSKLPNSPHLSLQIQVKVLDALSTCKLFPLFESHFQSSVFASGNSHFVNLIKLIAQKYVNIRLKDHGKKFLQKCEFKNEQSSRMYLNKLVLFQGR